jgi:hypothetical protein
MLAEMNEDALLELLADYALPVGGGGQPAAGLLTLRNRIAKHIGAITF